MQIPISSLSGPLIGPYMNNMSSRTFHSTSVIPGNFLVKTSFTSSFQRLSIRSDHPSSSCRKRIYFPIFSRCFSSNCSFYISYHHRHNCAYTSLTAARVIARASSMLMVSASSSLGDNSSKYSSTNIILVIILFMRKCVALSTGARG